MSDDSSRLAVLIDADNSSASHIDEIVSEVAKYGTATVKRAYGDWTTTQLSGWKDELNRHAISPMQQFAYTKGKNSTDSALIIDAMDLLYSGHVEGFVLVSSDSDFTRLATRLRESGKTVYGIGQRKTPEPFVKACDKFVYLELLGRRAHEPAASRAAGQGSNAEAEAAPDLRELLVAALNATAQDDGWATLGAVGQQLVRLESSFDPRLYGFSKLVELAKAQSYVDVDHPDSGSVRVRLLSARPPRRASAARKAPAKKAAAKGASSKNASAKKPSAEPAADRG